MAMDAPRSCWRIGSIRVLSRASAMSCCSRAARMCGSPGPRARSIACRPRTACVGSIRRETARRCFSLGPLVGKRYPPQEGDAVPIYLYRPGEWKRETMTTEPRGVLHAIHPVNWDGSPRQQLLTASYAGLHRFDFSNGQWVVTKLCRGRSAALAAVWQQRGAARSLGRASVSGRHRAVARKPGRGLFAGGRRSGSAR